MKRFLTIVTLICAMTLQTHAQEDSIAVAQKYAEQKAKLADKNPKDGKKQYEAGMAFVSNDLKDKKNYDQALQYLERALKIAQEQTVMKDTLMGLTCMGLSSIYMDKNQYDKAMPYMKDAIEAFDKELGKYDPVTNGAKLVNALLLMRMNALYGYKSLLEAFVYNDIAPENKRIENMPEANIIMELATEMLIASQTQYFRYALPLITFKGKRYLIIQSADWSIEQPLVGWMVPTLMSTENEKKTAKYNEALICDDKFQIIALTEEERKQNNLNFNFRHYVNNPRKLVSPETDARIWFLSPEDHGKILAAYREYKSKQK